MSRAEQKRKSLRNGLAAEEPLVVLGAHDAMSARLIENAGFGAVWVSGFGVSTMAHALPDMNLITMSEGVSCGIAVPQPTDRFSDFRDLDESTPQIL